MKHIFIFAVLSLFASSCRRQDIRQSSFEVPWLDGTNKVKAVAALSKYSGVDASSLSFDVENKTVTLKYDSMQVAKTNIRMALEAAGR